MNCNAFIGCTQGPDCPCGFMESDDSTQLETRNSDSSNPGYPFELLDAPMNFWDECNWWQKALVAIAAVIVCGLVGGMAASILTGMPK